LNNKGTALAILERYEEALEAFDKVIELEPNHIDAWNNKGAALHDLGKHEEAIKYFDKVIELSNDEEPFVFFR
jgi:tetratricopeptide (TPR) repeat protein